MSSSNSKKQFIDYLLHLADNSLILGHRNSEWTGHGPILEQDIALSNISLDLIGQARNFYQYAASLINQANGSTAVNEDKLAYLRNAGEFKNLLLVEQENGDWGKTMMRQFLFSCFQYYLYTALKESKDQQLAAIAGKSLKEITYHLRWSSEWVIRLGDGTGESNKRMQHALEALWTYTEEMFSRSAYEKAVLDREGFSLEHVGSSWNKKVNDILSEATLVIPENIEMNTGGKEGRHSIQLENLLNEMQHLQRTYPGCEW
jgi:ring-1,2-phenylacetyl-CoA epoxidase subunit PaaC